MEITVSSSNEWVRRDEELVARVLSGAGAHTLARRILAELGGVRGLVGVSKAALVAVDGVGRVRAERLAASIELGLRAVSVPRARMPKLAASRDVFELVGQELRHLRQEVFEVLTVDARNRLLDRIRVSVGTLTGSLVHPREVFRPVIAASAAGLVVVHNHPSGDPTPSREDLDITTRLVAAGEILGIRVLDHVIVGDGVYASLADRGEMRALSQTGEARRMSWSLDRG